MSFPGLPLKDFPCVLLCTVFFLVTCDGIDPRVVVGSYGLRIIPQINMGNKASLM